MRSSRSRSYCTILSWRTDGEAPLPQSHHQRRGGRERRDKTRNAYIYSNMIIGQDTGKLVTSCAGERRPSSGRLKIGARQPTVTIKRCLSAFCPPSCSWRSPTLQHRYTCRVLIMSALFPRCKRHNAPLRFVRPHHRYPPNQILSVPSGRCVHAGAFAVAANHKIVTSFDGLL